MGAIDMRAGLGEKPLTGGGRVTVHASRFLDAEAEVNRFPIGGAASNYPATQALFGARAGVRRWPFGIFAKARPGFLRFDDVLNHPNLGTRAALDLGVILEGYSRHHVAVRADFGDTVVFYGRETGTRHQFQGSFGISLWF